MLTKNPEVISLIESIGEHFRNNISNRYTRRALSSMTIDANSWTLIEELTEKTENYRYQGYHLDELYAQILAMGRFIQHARREVVPNPRLFAAGSEASSDRVFSNMAASNFGANLKVLADKIHDLYMKTVEIDKESSGPKAPAYTQIPELQELGHYLVE
ncbi:MAG: hypothetical protein NT080_11200 [Spirochaetes bacterium]|nr:hypothetical protein [Spirochaetota bacterium]